MRGIIGMKKLHLIVLLLCVSNCAYAAVPTQASSAEAQFDKLFSAVDADHDGAISKTEATQKAPAMVEAFTNIDTDRNGLLSKQEIKTFTVAMLKSREAFTRQLDAADKNKNGQLSKPETKKIPKLFDNFAAIDANHDGQLVIQEIVAYLRAQQVAAQAATAK
jgi:Ca2+-binding EF-hand superfamily protein